MQNVVAEHENQMFPAQELQNKNLVSMELEEKCLTYTGAFYISFQ